MPMDLMSRATGPSKLWFSTTILILLASVAFASRGLFGNVMGFVTGSVLGILNLAVFLGVDNNRRAGGMYADWPWKFGPFSPSTRKVASYLALTSWGIGIWNVYFLALELTR